MTRRNDNDWQTKAMAMSNPAPLISVGMPVFNGERYLEETIRSVLSQSLDDFELIITDNASTDRTGEICTDYARQDARVVYYRNSENIGAARNYNRAFGLASARYFRWMNADDLCAPTLHELCVRALEDNPDASLVYGKTEIIDQDGELIEQYEDNLDLQETDIVERYRHFFESVGLTNAIYGLMRTSAVRLTSLMGDGSYPAADTNFMAEMTLHGKFIELPEHLFQRRMHPKASSWNRDDDAEQIDFWNGAGGAFQWPHWKKNFAYLRALHAAPVGRRDLWRLRLYILRRMLWIRGSLIGDVSREMSRRLQNRGDSGATP